MEYIRKFYNKDYTICLTLQQGAISKFFKNTKAVTLPIFSSKVYQGGQPFSIDTIEKKLANGESHIVYYDNAGNVVGPLNHEVHILSGDKAVKEYLRDLGAI